MSDVVWSGELAEQVAEHERTYDDVYDETWKDGRKYGGLEEFEQLLDAAGA